MSPNVQALAYLQYRVLVNWLRRSLRSVIVWVLVIGVAAFSISGALVGGNAEPASGNEDNAVPSIFFEASAVLLFISTLIFAVWRGTGPPPRATAADVVFVLCSPIKARVQFAYLMFREVGTMLSILTIVVVASLIGPLIRAATSSDASIEGAFGSPTLGIWAILLIGGVTRLSIWVATEQIVVRDARRGHTVRLALRAALAATVATLLAFIALPLIRSEHDGLRAVVDHAAERVMMIGNVPPFSLLASIYRDDGSPFIALAALLCMAALITAAGLYTARDFVEPIAVMAERQTDARGQSIDTGNDIQWSTMSQLGSSPRMRITIRPFGSGPWALLWASLVRWARYQMAVAWISILTLLGLGLTTAVLVRMEIIGYYWIWILVLSMPVFSSFSMFLDELRKPFLFLTPGPPWKRLVAAGATSVIDGIVGSFSLVVIVLIVRARPFTEALALLVTSIVIGYQIQATVGLVQVLLPSWLNRKIRTTLTFGANVLAFIPAAIAFLLGLSISGVVAGFLAGVATTLVVGSLVLWISALLFDRLEMPN